MTSLPSTPLLANAPEPGASLRDETRAIFRSAVLDAAEEEFAQRGFEAARMQDVARRARVAVGTVYNHFANKDELVVALLSERGDGVFRAFAPLPTDPPTFEGRFLARFGRMQAHLAKHRAFFAVMMRNGLISSDDNHPGDARIMAPSIALETRMASEVRALLVQGMEEGALAEEDPVRLGRFLKGAMRTVMIEGIADGRADIEADGAWALEHFLRGARAHVKKTAAASSKDQRAAKPSANPTAKPSANPSATLAAKPSANPAARRSHPTPPAARASAPRRKR